MPLRPYNSCALFPLGFEFCFSSSFLAKQTIFIVVVTPNSIAMNKGPYSCFVEPCQLVCSIQELEPLRLIYLIYIFVTLDCILYVLVCVLRFMWRKSLLSEINHVTHG